MPPRREKKQGLGAAVRAGTTDFSICSIIAYPARRARGKQDKTAHFAQKSFPALYKKANCGNKKARCFQKKASESTGRKSERKWILFAAAQQHHSRGGASDHHQAHHAPHQTAAEEEEEEAAEDAGAEETDWLSLELLSLLWLSEPDWLEKSEVLELLWPGRLDPLPDWLLETAPEPPWAVF